MNEITIQYDVYQEALKRIKKVCNLYKTCEDKEDVVIQQDSAIIIQNAIEVASNRLTNVPNSDKLTLFKVVTYLDKKYKWAKLIRPNGLKELARIEFINLDNMKDEVVVDYYSVVNADVITIELSDGKR